MKDLPHWLFFLLFLCWFSSSLQSKEWTAPYLWTWSLLYLPSLPEWLILPSRFKYHPYTVDSPHLYLHCRPHPWSGLGGPCEYLDVSGTSNITCPTWASDFLPQSCLSHGFPILVKGNFILSVAQARAFRTTLDMTLSHHTFDAAEFRWLYLQNSSDSIFITMILSFLSQPMLKEEGFKFYFLEWGYILTVVRILLHERFVPPLLKYFLRCRCNEIFWACKRSDTVWEKYRLIFPPVSLTALGDMRKYWGQSFLHHPD